MINRMELSRDPAAGRIAALALAVVVSAATSGCSGEDAHGATSTTSTSTTSTTSTSSGGPGGSGGSGGDGGNGGSGGDGGLAPTHSGIISIQDMALHDAPQAGHGLTVQVLFSAARAPVYEEMPGQIAGCKAYSYDLQSDPQPPLTDQGVVTIEGLPGGAIDCSFQETGGYACPVAAGSGETSVAPGQPGTAELTIASAAFSAADVGRYLKVGGATNGGNNGAFPIVAVLSATTAVVVNMNATAEAFTASYVVVAGAGPIPGGLNDPFAGGDELTVRLTPGGEMAFDLPGSGPIAAGDAFVLDDASSAVISALPLDGAAVTLSCAGEGGNCGPAQGTIVRITTTDGSVAGLSPFAMPAPVDKVVEIQCVALGEDGTITVPAEAMAILEAAHQETPITRIRTAFMREGVATLTNPAPKPPNTVYVVVGHGLLGFTSP